MKDLIYKLLAILLPMMFEALRKLLTNEKFVYYGDKVLDLCERGIQKTATELDDMILLPLIAIIREAARIPDLPDEEPVVEE